MRRRMKPIKGYMLVGPSGKLGGWCHARGGRVQSFDVFTSERAAWENVLPERHEEGWTLLSVEIRELTPKKRPARRSKK